MHWFAIGTALLVALAIIAIGTQYIVSPLTATRSFGLPLPENCTNIAWWLRLKGGRDIVSGLAVLAFMMWSAPGFSFSQRKAPPKAPSACTASRR